ncbi:MAG TPA: DUF4124 domain-containing protein [Pseudoxanthomonas sp.]
MRALSPSLFLVRACTVVLLAGACSTALAGKLYQWKDAKGVTHYSDSPPPGDQYKDRRIDNRGAPSQEAVPAGKSLEDPQCATAKRNLELLAGKSDVQQDTDGDGKPDTTLSETDRANQRELAQATAKAYCKPAAATAGR